MQFSLVVFAAPKIIEYKMMADDGSKTEHEIKVTDSDDHHFVVVERIGTVRLGEGGYTVTWMDAPLLDGEESNTPVAASPRVEFASLSVDNSAPLRLEGIIIVTQGVIQSFSRDPDLDSHYIIPEFPTIDFGSTQLVPIFRIPIAQANSAGNVTVTVQLAVVDESGSSIGTYKSATIEFDENGHWLSAHIAGVGTLTRVVATSKLPASVTPSGATSLEEKGSASQTSGCGLSPCTDELNEKADTDNSTKAKETAGKTSDNEEGEGIESDEPTDGTDEDNNNLPPPPATEEQVNLPDRSPAGDSLRKGPDITEG